MIQDFFSKLAKRERLLVICGISFLFLAFMDRLILGPILSQMKVIDKSMEAKMQMIKRNLRVISFRDSILREYAANEKYLSISETNQQEMIANDLHAVESLAAQNTVTISNIKAGEITEGLLSKELQVDLECEGTLLHTLQFIRALEDSNFLFRVKRFSMTPKSKTSELIKSSVGMSRTIINKEEFSADTGNDEKT